jgi:hypothetical protein
VVRFNATTFCPSLTAIDTTSPGIGHNSFLPVSAAETTGISRAAAASLSVKTLIGAPSVQLFDYRKHWFELGSSVRLER